MAAPKGNQYAVGNKGGREPFFKTVEELSKKIDDYFTSIQTRKKGKVIDNGTPTLSGLAYYLGFEERKSLYDYKEKEEFVHIIKKARLFIESCYEKRLSGTVSTGAIFALKNMGWRDAHEINADVKTTNVTEEIRQELLNEYKRNAGN